MHRLWLVDKNEDVTKLRDDIQALRGWAVALVLLDHFQIGPFAHGYLGVDIFFVISGFLITGIIAKGVRARNFSFAQFYFRRAKRLLPAAYVTVLLTIVGSIWFLASLEMRDLTDQVFGALTWTTNFVLLWQTDYFANSAAMKPLLHMWSLAVEEQFYLVAPALLVFTPQRFWKLAICTVFAVSLALCIYWDQVNPPAAFYMLPSRAWELAIGGFGALLATSRGAWTAPAFWLAIAVLAAVPVWSTGFPHPGLDAILVCAATLAVILARSEAFGEYARKVGLTFIGDISYSLYLVHWPIAAFMNNAFIGPVPLEARIFGLALSLALAWPLYRFIEKPIHHSEMVRLSPRFVSIAASSTLALAALQFGVGSATGNTFAFLRRPNVGLSATCASKPLENDACRKGDHPTVLIWGDSYAMALVAGIVDNTTAPLAQATLSACPPIKGMALHRPERESPSDWAKFCIGFNDTVLAKLAQHTELKTVIMSSPWRDYDHVDVWTGPASSPQHQKASLSRAIEAFRETIQYLQSLGKKVIVVGSPPIMGDGDVSLCVERVSTGKITFGANCSIDSRAARARDTESFEFLGAARSEGASSVNLYDAMCDDKTCMTQVDGRPIYRDGGHLSYEGSRVVVARSALPNLLKQ